MDYRARRKLLLSVAVIALFLNASLAIGDDEADYDGSYDSSLNIESNVSLGLEDLRSSSDREKLNPWEMGAKRHHSSWSGTAGLIDIKEAGSSAPGTFALGLFGGFFKYSDYLVFGDTHTYVTGTLNLRVTPLPFLELHAGLWAVSNQNTMETPQLFQRLGEFDFGIKAFVSPLDFLTLGFDLNLFFKNSIGNVGADFSGTGVGMDALATFDFAELNSAVPLRSHLMVGYMFDNGSNLVSDIEANAGGCGAIDADGQVEYSGCLSPVERTSLGINRNDQFRIGIGFDLALPYVSPILEYHINVPVNRQDFVCPRIPGSYDSCMVDEKGKGMHQWMNFGLRFLPPIRDLSLDFGVELGLAGYAPSVHEMAAARPYMIKFGLSYQFDPKVSTRIEPLTEVVEPEPSTAIIAGMVHSSKSEDTPVANAIIAYKNIEVNPQVATATGRFNSYELPIGVWEIRITAQGYEEGVFDVIVSEPGIIQQYFPLQPKESEAKKEEVKTGNVTVLLVDEDDKLLSGIEVTLSGMISKTLTSGDDGMITFESKPGNVGIAIMDKNYLYKQKQIVVAADTHSKIEIPLRKVPKTASVSVEKDHIAIKDKIHFMVDSEEIKTDSFSLLDEIADLLMKNQQIKKIVIQGHTDNRGARDYNLELSQRRAKSVKTYLEEAGVAAARLEAVGFGPDKPIAPNLTDTGRARNRRVEFHIADNQ